MTENTNYVICDDGKKLSFSYALYTSAGDRTLNEDYMLVGANRNSVIFALADGMSKYGGGEIAAKAACTSAISEFAACDDLGEVSAFARMYESAISKIKSEQQQLSPFNKIYSTLNLLYFYSNNAYLSHIGNTRTYFFRDNKIISKTNDHSQAAVMANAGIISEDEIRFKRGRKVLLKTLGAESGDMDYDINSPIRIKAGDAFLICSDGLWEQISDRDIEETLSISESPDKWIYNMVKSIENAEINNKDNLSAIAIRINGVQNDQE